MLTEYSFLYGEQVLLTFGVNILLPFFYWSSMKLSLEDVQRRVTTTDDARSKNVEEMKAWQKMYDLDAGFSITPKEAIKEDGREQVTSSDPYNVIGLAMRLIASQPKIDVPPRDEKDNQAKEDSEQVERWLTAMYQNVNGQQGRNFVEDLKMLVFKRGRAYIEAKWIKEDRPKLLQKKRFPILIRTLDPMNVGFHRGPTEVEYAYHKYEDEKINVRARYPDLKMWDDPKPAPEDLVKTEADTVCVVDFWYMAPDTGKIWNCITVEEEFAKEPVETDYPIVPIIEAIGEGGGKSILHAINGLWQYQCRLLSNIGTAVLWAAWPHYMVMNDTGQVVNDMEIRPGATSFQPAGTKVDVIKPDVNLTVIKEMLGQVDGKISQATFPGVLYGDAGGMQAGYGVNILSQSASGRVKSAQESIEMALQWLNTLVLALVEEMGSNSEGVELWARSAASEKLYKVCLYPRQLQGYYENQVMLKLNLPTDDQAKQVFGLQLAEKGLLSRQSFWDKYLSITVPTDEQNRIDIERAEQHPAIQNKKAVMAYMLAYPETWEAYLRGTELLDIAYRMAEEVIPPEQWTDGLIEWKRKQMVGNKPPIDPMAPMSLAGPPPGPSPLQPPGMAGPMGGGIPPVMAAQFSPNSVGLPQQGAADTFGTLMGNPLQPQETLDNLANLPPQGA